MKKKKKMLLFVLNIARWNVYSLINWITKLKRTGKAISSKNVWGILRRCNTSKKLKNRYLSPSKWVIPPSSSSSWREIEKKAILKIIGVFQFRNNEHSIPEMTLLAKFNYVPLQHYFFIFSKVIKVEERKDLRLTSCNWHRWLHQHFIINLGGLFIHRPVFCI